MNQLLKDSILALQQLRVELQGSVEDSVILELNEVIAKLQLMDDSELQLSKWQIRLLFAEALLLIPSVAESIASLIQLAESAASH